MPFHIPGSWVYYPPLAALETKQNKHHHRSPAGKGNVLGWLLVPLLALHIPTPLLRVLGSHLVNLTMLAAAVTMPLTWKWLLPCV